MSAESAGIESNAGIDSVRHEREGPTDPNRSPGIAPSGWPQRLFLIGVVVFLMNMAACWAFAWSAASFVRGSLFEALGGTNAGDSSALGRAKGASANESVFLNRYLEAATHVKAISNKQTIVIVAMAGAFSLFAIGFALFVMGIESAYSIDANLGERGGLVVRSAAPGLAVFLIGAVVLCFALSTKTSVEFAGFTVYPDQPVSNKGGPTTGSEKLEIREVPEVLPLTGAAK